MNNASHSISSKIPASIALLIMTLVIVGAIIFAQHDMPTSINSTQAMTVGMSMSNQTYKDGTYTKTGSYESPAGTEGLTVTLVLSNSVVSTSLVMHGSNDPTASSYQSLFINGYKGQVNGRKLSDINLTNISGSSLTPKGFMDALHKIEADAKS